MLRRRPAGLTPPLPPYSAPPAALQRLHTHREAVKMPFDLIVSAREPRLPRFPPARPPHALPPLPRRAASSCRRSPTSGATAWTASTTG